MAKKSFEDTLEENLLRFTQGAVKDLLAEAKSPVRMIEQTDQSNRSDRSIGQTDRSYRFDRLSGQTDVSDGPTSLTDQTDQKDRPSSQTNKTDRSVRPDSELVKVVPRLALTTSAQKAVFRYFQINGSHVATYEVIASESRVPRGTVRAVIKKMESLGFLTKSDWWQGNIRAIRFVFNGTNQTNQTDRPDIRHGQTNQTDLLPVMKIDREKTLSISQERIDLTWPRLAATGFGSHQLKQIHQALAELGKPTDRIVQSLDHAEWELENGKMVDKDGKPVTDPCSWVFRSLARTGYYRRPVGYVSAEEQAAIDEEMQAKAVSLAHQKAEQAKFEAWKDGLAPKDLADALRGHPGGPKDAWLRRVWKERQTAGDRQ